MRETAIAITWTAAVLGSMSALATELPRDNPWFVGAQAELRASRALARSDAPARNVILFIGDGMSLATVTAARILEGQLRGEPGEDNLLSFERLPHTALAKTYSTNEQVTDSAATATALLSGVKTKGGVLGVDEHVRVGDCASMSGREVPTLLELAEDAGRATGVVTTTTLTHATPASAYAHTPSRNWEADTDKPEDAAACVDIARQLVEFAHGDGIEVALGGGRDSFLPRDTPDPEDPGLYGVRGDGLDLTAAWRARFGAGAAYVWNAAQLGALDPAHTTHLLGLFERRNMEFEVDRGRDLGGEPSLAQMVRAAIAILARDPDGFFLLVEGGRIDHAHHLGNAYRALHDTLALADAVSAALELTDARETLVLVTADHGHVMEIAGHPKRGNPILGKVVGVWPDGSPADALALDGSGMPYTTLLYANGPGHLDGSDRQPAGPKRFPHDPRSPGPRAQGRTDLTVFDTEAPAYMQESAIPLRYETHSGTDVIVYAGGPGAHLVHGVREQNFFFHVMLHAMRLLEEPEASDD